MIAAAFASIALALAGTVSAQASSSVAALVASLQVNYPLEGTVALSSFHRTAAGKVLGLPTVAWD